MTQKRKNSIICPCSYWRKDCYLMHDANFQLKYHIFNYNYRYYLSRRVLFCDADKATRNNKGQHLVSPSNIT